MITLKVMDRCQNCPEFEVDANKSIIYGDAETTTDIVVCCKNESLCNTLMEFLKKENERGD